MENETKWYDGGSYVEELEYFNELMTSLGKSHIKLASMEWNLGPGKYKSDHEHTHFRTALTADRNANANDAGRIGNSIPMEHTMAR